MSDIEKIIVREFDVSYCMYFDHAVWCGVAVPLAECPKLAEHRTDAEQGADQLAAMRLAEGQR